MCIVKTLHMIPTWSFCSILELPLSHPCTCRPIHHCLVWWRVQWRLEQWQAMSTLGLQSGNYCVILSSISAIIPKHKQCTIPDSALVSFQLIALSTGSVGRSAVIRTDQNGGKEGKPELLFLVPCYRLLFPVKNHCCQIRIIYTRQTRCISRRQMQVLVLVLKGNQLSSLFKFKKADHNRPITCRGKMKINIRDHDSHTTVYMKPWLFSTTFPRLCNPFSTTLHFTSD